MKAFYFALAVLVLFAGLLIADTVCIHRRTEALAAAADALLTEEGDVAEVRRRWDELQPILELTVSGRELSPIGEHIAVVEALANPADDSSAAIYRAACGRLCDLIHRLMDSETVSFENILSRSQRNSLPSANKSLRRVMV